MRCSVIILKIRKLIEKLKAYNQEADITLTTSEDITISYICKDPKTDQDWTPQTTMQCFIEAMDECPQCVHEYMNGDERWCSFYDKVCKEVQECYQFEEFDER